MRRLVVAALAVLTGCSMSADTKLAEQGVRRFHEMLDTGQFEAIYSAADDTLKGEATQENFVALLDAVRRKLGPTKSLNQQTWHVSYNTSGTFVTLNYNTSYTEGDAVETFVYRLRDGTALLAGYHINSYALIVN